MKKYIFLAVSALTLASCTSEDFLGNTPGNVQSNTSAINFDGGTGKISRATGADAAKLLNNEFIVAGFKSDETAPTSGISANKVFDHYVIKWTKNSAGTTTDNTSDWNYVGNNPYSGLTQLANGTAQTIKYWDYNAAQYDYVAFSTGKIKGVTTGTAQDDIEVLLTAVTPSTANTAPTLSSDNIVTGGAYTITGTAKALSGCYIADLTTAYKSADYKKEVNLTFRNLTTKARIALYETIPGYSVKDVKFHQSEETTSGQKITPATETNATLYTSKASAADYFFKKGTAGIYFPTVGSSNKGESDYNKAHVVFFPKSKETTMKFGNVIYDNNALKTTSKDPSYVGTNDETTPNYYQTVIPNETGTTLTLCVDYTLVADDKSGEEIHVYGAKAIIPAIYAQWKSNFAYTYIFKISDNTNGWTDTNKTQSGLYPITFDAVVADSEIGNQTTITTVATPSITTYQKGHDITKNEYGAGDIYVMVNENGKLKNDLDKAALYTISDPKTVGISEATVHDALTIGSTTNGSVTTGRNGIKLTNAKLETTTTIPGVDGNNITVKANEAAKFNATANNTYAFVYETTKGEVTASYYYTAVTPAVGTDVSNDYYTDPDGKIAATGTANGTTVYYQKITNTNKTYAIKVIKVVE
jgi:hypothetical protein